MHGRTTRASTHAHTHPHLLFQLGLGHLCALKPVRLVQREAQARQLLLLLPLALLVPLLLPSLRLVRRLASLAWCAGGRAVVVAAAVVVVAVVVVVAGVGGSEC
jgi:hypothetical protein